MATFLGGLSRPHAAKHVSEIVGQFAGISGDFDDQLSPAPPAPLLCIDSVAA